MTCNISRLDFFLHYRPEYTQPGQAAKIYSGDELEECRMSSFQLQRLSYEAEALDGNVYPTGELEYYIFKHLAMSWVYGTGSQRAVSGQNIFYAGDFQTMKDELHKRYNALIHHPQPDQYVWVHTDLLNPQHPLQAMGLESIAERVRGYFRDEGKDYPHLKIVTEKPAEGMKYTEVVITDKMKIYFETERGLSDPPGVDTFIPYVIDKKALFFGSGSADSIFDTGLAGATYFKQGTLLTEMANQTPDDLVWVHLKGEGDFNIELPNKIAHEIGHTFGLYHAEEHENICNIMNSATSAALCISEATKEDHFSFDPISRSALRCFFSEQGCY